MLVVDQRNGGFLSDARFVVRGRLIREEVIERRSFRILVEVSSEKLVLFSVVDSHRETVVPV